MAHKDAQAILDSLVVFCPLHGWQAQVFGQPAEGYDGYETPYLALLAGKTARCEGMPYGPYCGRELVLGTFDAVRECTLDESLPTLPEAPAVRRGEV